MKVTYKVGDTWMVADTPKTREEAVALINTPGIDDESRMVLKAHFHFLLYGTLAPISELLKILKAGI